MRQLIINEFRHMRIVLLATLAVVTVTGISYRAVAETDIAFGFRGLLVMVPIYYGLMMPAMSFRSEARGGTWRLLRSLPATGSTVVSAKFIAALLMLAAASVASLAALTLASHQGQIAQALSTLSIPISLGLLFLGIDFALCFWVGERNASVGLILLLVAVQLAGLVALIRGPGGGFEAVEMFIRRASAWAGTWPGMFISVGVASVLLAASWYACVRIYDGRDITHAM